MTFYEIIDGLIDAGDKVPADKRSGDGYTAARKRIHDELASPHDVEVACYGGLEYGKTFSRSPQENRSLWRL